MFRVSPYELEEKAYRLRRDLIDLVYQTGSGHLDTSLSLVEIWLSIVYSNFFRFDPEDGGWNGRDAIFLSEGHACPLQYLVNAELGYYGRDAVFEGNRKPFTPFQGHTRRILSHGFENSNGSLGIGLWQAYGYAMETDRYVFCIAGDGEFQEPSSIGLLTAPLYLKSAPNFILIINYNRLAQDSQVDLGPIGQVGRLYNWQVINVTDGHSFEELGKAYIEAIADTGRPSLLICDTIKGKWGDPSKEAQLGSHGKPPNKEEYQAYIEGLESYWRKRQRTLTD